MRQKKQLGKRRGHTSCGRGNTKHGRGRGSRMGNPHIKSKGGGYRNIAHARKYQPERFNKKGFNSLVKPLNAINVSELSKLTKEKQIDLSKFGYQKLLGGGIPPEGITVTVEKASENAVKKIKDAKGVVKVSGESQST